VPRCKLRHSGKFPNPIKTFYPVTNDVGRLFSYAFSMTFHPSMKAAFYRLGTVQNAGEGAGL
jgi:hypothetical protein